MTERQPLILMARRSEATRRGLRVFGVVRGYAVVGCPPDIMGIGPAVALSLIHI